MKNNWGSNITISYGILNACKIATAMNSNCLQIHYQSNEDKVLSENELNNIKKYIKNNNLFLVNHSSFRINLSRPVATNKKFLDIFIDDLNVVQKLGGHGSILHMGKKLNLDTDVAIQNMVESVIYIYENTKNLKAKILIENSAGEGTALYKIEEMNSFYKLLPEYVKNNVEFVIDTCHAFVAGYDITNKKLMKNFFKKFDEYFGLKKLACIHLNDSKDDVNSKKDRHENLFLGFIGKNNKGLINIIKFGIKNKIPLILETPNNLHSIEIQLINLISKKN